MERCVICRRPMQMEYVEMYRIGLDNQPILYRNVRRYSCPEGCRGVRLDFSRAQEAAPGVLLKVVPQVKPLKKRPDFNDRLLAVGLVGAYALLLAGIAVIPAAIGVKVGSALALTLGLLAVYRFSTQRVVLPSYFPLPYPTATTTAERDTIPVPAAASAASPAPAPAAGASAPTAAATATQTAAPQVKGGGIPMKVIVGGQEFLLDVGPGENLLTAALDRDVAVDYSCLEGLCDSCAVRVLEGLENLSPPTKEEFDMLGEDVHRGMRLACQVKVNGPVTIEQ